MPSYLWARVRTPREWPDARRAPLTDTRVAASAPEPPICLSSILPYGWPIDASWKGGDVQTVLFMNDTTSARSRPSGLRTDAETEI
jgi:hypothetical protein